jgi:hypothetical protein
MRPSYFTKETESKESILPNWQTNKPYVSSGERKRFPWCTVVSDHDDVLTGGVMNDPDEKAINPK